jgi:hypothetical protein
MNVGADCERHHNRIETADGLGMMAVANTLDGEVEPPGMTHVTINERYTP